MLCISCLRQFQGVGVHHNRPRANDSYVGILPVGVVCKSFLNDAHRISGSLPIIGSYVCVMATPSGTTNGTGSGLNGVRIFVCGSALMILGIAIGKQLALQPADGTMIAFARGRELVTLVPAVAGALLTFWGGVRMSLTMRPLHLLVLGPILLVGAEAGPLLAAKLFPEIGNYGWPGVSVLPLFTYRIVGFILLSTCPLRLFLRTRNKS